VAHYKSSLICLLTTFLVAGCSENISKKAIDRPEAWQTHLETVAMPDKDTVAVKESIYVPVYAHIYYEDQNRLLELTETVSMRNTDPDNSIILTDVKHYQTDGSLIKNYLTQPVIIKPMATADFVVPRTDISGGTGANFVINWVSTHRVSEPIAESVMVSTGSAQTVSFLSRGTVVKREVFAVKSPSKSDSKKSVPAKAH
jgi:hypothetical protein